MLACNHAPAVDNSTPALRRILWREYHVYGQTAYRRLASISLLPVLEAILHQFPFRIRGFHSDNGSEFLNRRVAKLLHKLLISEFTKSRAHRTTDNALVEGKNGAVVRKHIGHEPIARRARCGVSALLPGLFQPLFELSPSLRVRHRGAERARQAPAPLSARGLPHTLRKADFARQLGAALETRHQRRPARTTSTADERHRLRPEHAATQEKTAGELPLPLVNTSRIRRGLPAPDSAGMGGGGGSSTDVSNRGHTRLRFPLPLEHPQKGDPHAAPALCPTNPISGSFLDWKMLQPQKTRATSK